MNIEEFAEKYYLHDSSIEKINFDEKNKNLTLTIEFCFWMQNWYKNNEPTNGKISVTFENVSLFEYEQHDFKNFLENLDTEVIETDIDDDGAIKFIIREYVDYPLQMDFWIIKIKSENVKVTELERYNL